MPAPGERNPGDDLPKKPLYGGEVPAKTELRRVLPLLAIVVVALISARTARAQNSDPCTKTDLPTPVIHLIKAKFPGWRPKQITDLDPRSRELWLKGGSNECPGIAVGHFESPDRLSYAVFLVPQSESTGGYTLLVFNRMPTGDAYVWKLLGQARATTYSGTVIETAPPGKYSDY